MSRGYRRNPTRRYASHPLSDSCRICERDLGGTEALLKRPDGWVHRACWEAEKGE